MTEDLSDIWDPFITALPQYLNSKNPTVLSEEKQKKLDEKIVEARYNDLEYLNRHPEIRAIIRELFRKITTAQPLNVRKFVKTFFSQSEEDLQDSIDEHLKTIPVVVVPTKSPAEYDLLISMGSINLPASASSVSAEIAEFSSEGSSEVLTNIQYD